MVVLQEEEAVPVEAADVEEGQAVVDVEGEVAVDVAAAVEAVAVEGAEVEAGVVVVGAEK